MERKESESDSTKQDSDSESESIKRNRQDSTKQESDSNWIRELDSRIGFDKKKNRKCPSLPVGYSKNVSGACQPSLAQCVYEIGH